MCLCVCVDDVPAASHLPALSTPSSASPRPTAAAAHRCQMLLPTPQGITSESLNADNQSAFWHNRYTLRSAYDPHTGLPRTAAAPGAGAGAAVHDVPAFLQAQKGLILSTGKYLNVMRQCRATPPRTLPLGTRLGELRLQRSSLRLCVRVCV